MIDARILRTDPNKIRAMLEKRKVTDIDLDHLIQVDQELCALTSRIEQLRSRQKSIGASDRDQSRQIKTEIAELTTQQGGLQRECGNLMSRLPNFLAPDTPEGEDDSDNIPLSYWGEIPQFSFTPLTHEVVGSRLGILDTTRGTKVSGAGFYYWKGDGAKLLQAIFNLAFDMLDEDGFARMVTPVVAKERTLYGTGYLPFFPDDIYHVGARDLCLIGTSEQVLVGYHADEILEANKLPICYSALTPCFRTEAGSHGKESRGTFRVHQFHKVEQIVFCQPDESERWHEKCLLNEQRLMKSLLIPHRVVRICVGDLGAPAYKKYDVEGWFAGFNAYRETHSNSNLLDYQTRRLSIRFKCGKATVFPHTISATMVTDRAALAILENNQQVDGSVIIPETLRQYMGGQKVIKR